MRCFSAFLLLLAVTVTRAQEPLPPIGEWREHLPYNSALDLAVSDGKIFCATPYSLFSVTPSAQEAERYSRMTGLSETGVSAIAADNNGKLLVAYTNGNIDILYGQDVYNIPDLKRSTVMGDKTVYRIFPGQQTFYLCTGLGIVLVNADRRELSDTWLIGQAGNAVRVNGFTPDAGYYYAATQEGLKRAAVQGANPANFANWQLLSGHNGLPAGACRNVFRVENRLLAEVNNVLYQWDGTAWRLFYTDGWFLVNSSVSAGRIVLCQRDGGGAGRVLLLNPDGSIFRLIGTVAAVSFPRNALLWNNEPWVADQFAGLSRFPVNGNNYQSFTLNSPQGIAGGDLLVDDRVFYAAAGSVNDSWNYQYNGDGIFRLGSGQWENINRYRIPVLDSLLDFMALATDRRDASLWAGSFGGGLLHWKAGQPPVIYKQNRLGETVGDPGSYRVAGLAFDPGGNLWIANYGAAQPLRVRKSDGGWQSFSVPFPLADNALTQVLVDGNGYKWLVSPKGNGLFSFDDNGSIDQPGDDRWKRYSAGAGQGNLPSTEVHCVAEDRQGYLWVGTDNGIGVIPCTETVFSAGGCEAYWPVVPNGLFSGYLFRGQAVRHIAVDGANRKWVATANGVFLVSANGEKLIYRFTEDNSPLLSSDVRRIAIDGFSGEVFFATSRGLCSFRGTATEGAASLQTVTVFPNPVPPGYTGSIALRGLTENAWVKITELDGRLVFQTRSLGGQAIWDGRNYKGQKIASGVYLVLVAREGQREEAAGKIFFLQR